MLQQRAKDMGYMDERWTLSVTGHVDAREDPEVAIRREMKEEIGVKVELKNIGTYKKKLVGMGFTFATMFVGKYNGEKVVLDEREVQGTAFFRIGEIRDELEKNPDKFIPEMPDMLEIYEEWLNKK